MPSSAGVKWAVVLHGGAGASDRQKLDSERQAEYRSSLAKALQTASDLLNRGGSALDAVEEALIMLEDDPLFNAGRGSAFTSDGTIELDAAIMDGATLEAGAVALVARTRHPISLARAVMEKSPHVMLAGPAADAFAREQGIEPVEPGFFFTERRWQALMEHLKKDGKRVPLRPQGAPPSPSPPSSITGAPEPDSYGTVGVVALDRAGRLAAGTSTGGTTGKRPGRVGDTPVIGAGTYSNASCAVSGTGTGEYFIRLTVAREISALVGYRGMELQAACDAVVHSRLAALQPESGGVIALLRDGCMAWSFNTPMMFRARCAEGGAPQISIFTDEP